MPKTPDLPYGGYNWASRELASKPIEGLGVFQAAGGGRKPAVDRRDDAQTAENAELQQNANNFAHRAVYAQNQRLADSGRKPMGFGHPDFEALHKDWLHANGLEHPDPDLIAAERDKASRRSMMDQLEWQSYGQANMPNPTQGAIRAKLGQNY